jgi:hypothetical protein
MPTSQPDPEYQLLEIQQDPVADPDGDKLSAYLAAHFACERAQASRNRAVGWLALLGVALWVSIALGARRSITAAALAGFAVAAAVVVRAGVREWSCRRTARAAMASVRTRVR